MAHGSELNFKATELRLGLPGTDDDSDHTKNSNINNKRALPEDQNESKCVLSATKPGTENQTSAPAPKAQIVGWPPVRSYRKSIITETKKTENEIYYVKVSMDGAPYLRKIDLKLYNGYQQLLKALETMFKFTLGEYSEREGYKGSDFAPAYEDKDGDLMLLGDVPWNMFMSSCKRLRIMKGSEAKGLGSCGV